MTRPDGMEGVIAAHELIGKSAPALDDHACRLVTTSRDDCGCKRIVVGCTGCDWITEADGSQVDAFIAHLADALRAAGFGLVSEAKAEALREAADEMEVAVSRGDMIGV